MDAYNPEAVGIETGYIGKISSAVMRMGETRGVLMSTFLDRETVLIHPSKLRSIIGYSGWGNMRDKTVAIRWCKMVLGIDVTAEYRAKADRGDAADALVLTYYLATLLNFKKNH